jgi:type VI secretion system protein ImpA
MASPSLLNFAALLAPIPGGSNPAGSSVPHTTRQKLATGRIEPHPDDLQNPNVKKADWPGVVRLAQDTLTGVSKDLLVAANLTEALVKLHGFAGLRDGLLLLRLLLEQCWDRMYPVPDVEEGEGMEVRAGPFRWLGYAAQGARFPSTLLLVPLVTIDSNPHHWQDWQRAQKKEEGALEPDAFELKAQPLNPNIAADLAQSLEEFNRLEQVLQTRLGENSPGLSELRQSIEDCQGLLQIVVKRLQPPPPPPPPPTSPGQPGVQTTPSRTRAVSSRAEAYTQLAHIASVLEELEPHSPVPDLLRKAIELGKLPFRQLIQEMIRSTDALAEVRREFGLKPPPE